MIYTQKQIYDYLRANPLNVDVSVGDVENLNGGDYIFLNFTNDELMGSDDRGTYQSYIQVTIATRDFRNRKTLVGYVKNYLNVAVTYEMAVDYEYFVANCTCGVLMYEDD